MVVTDLFRMAGRTYLVYTDRFTAWTEVASTAENTNAKTITDILRRYFVNFGVPEELSSDGGASILHEIMECLPQPIFRLLCSKQW